MNTHCVTDRAAGAGAELETPEPDGDACSVKPRHGLLTLLPISEKANVFIQGFLNYYLMPARAS